LRRSQRGCSRCHRPVYGEAGVAEITRHRLALAASAQGIKRDVILSRVEARNPVLPVRIGGSRLRVEAIGAI
jgi:hypothetical protein